MTDAPTTPSAAELFRRWKDFLDGGTLPAADAVAVAHPQLTAPLHKLIDEYLAGRATDVVGPDPEPDGATDLPTIPGYTILGSLGRGGMGEVYHVRDRLDTEFALKLARRKQLSATGRERFLAEARAMRSLDHPHVAKIHHYDEVDGRPYFTMGLYAANLTDKWADFCACPKSAARLMLAVADGVGHLHGRGFIHRDLKPSNILIDRAGRPVVSDFGLIKGRADRDPSAGDSSANGSAETHATGARRSHTLAGLVLGTRRYMAPEQAAGLNHLAGPGWDVWALGVMLHELLTGQPPRSSAAPERLLKPGEPDNLPLAKLKPGLDPRLTRIVHRCLARDPVDRYPDAAAVAADLRRWLTRRRRRFIGTGAALLMIAMAGTAIGAALLPGDPDPEPSVEYSVAKVAPVERPEPLAAVPEFDRKKVLAEFQRKLLAGDEVEVIGPKGMPTWFEVVAGDDVVKPHPSDVDGALTIDSSRMILVDLPPTGLDRYRFEVEVLQRTDNRAARFGAYAGRQRRTTKTGELVDCFAALWFNDGQVGDPPDTLGRWTLGLRSYYRRTGGVGGACELGAGGTGTYTPKKNRPDQWHVLAVDVTPERMDWSFDGRATRSIALPLDDSSSLKFAQVAALPPADRAALTPDGGYGLLVWQGPAGFRNARVRPLGK